MENDQSTAFGERLKWARKRAKLTQKAAADKVGMSQGTLAELEGDGQGSSYTPALAALYNVNSVWLATGKGEALKAQESLARAEPAEPPQPRRGSPTPEAYAKVVQLFGEAEEETRQVILTILQSNADERRRDGSIVRDNQSQGTGGGSDASI